MVSVLNLIKGELVIHVEGEGLELRSVWLRVSEIRKRRAMSHE